MSEGIEINRSELQEMARVILCEINGAQKSQVRVFEQDTFERVSQPVLNDDKDFDRFERWDFGFANEGSLRKQYEYSDGIEEFYPRLNRREFFEQRVQRRRQRQEQVSDSFNSSMPAEDNTIKWANKLVQLDLPEKLSDNFCRDARRYDGAFERY